ncbi:MAG: YicC family protein [Clostridiales bacterium]|nr:YicC family protein [Clostridiales bacterium]
MKSMTGYGKAEYSSNGITLTVEIKSVNNRFLDLSYKCPRSFTCLQDVMRSTVQNHLSRGKVDLFVNYYKQGDREGAVELDSELATAYVAVAKQIKKQFPSLKNDFTVSSLMKTPDVLRLSQESFNVDEISPILVETINKACENLNAMRLFEGEKLKADVLSRVKTIEETVGVIKERAPLVSKEYHDKILKKVQTVLEGSEVDESRLLMEVQLFADKSNIDEEITRLYSHISQLRSICEQTGEVGKKLDFLVQEFNRESNTICSKANDIEVTDNALKLKCEIEKIREQIQNIE